MFHVGYCLKTSAKFLINIPDVGKLRSVVSRWHDLDHCDTPYRLIVLIGGCLERRSEILVEVFRRFSGVDNGVEILTSKGWIDMWLQRYDAETNLKFGKQKAGVPPVDISEHRKRIDCAREMLVGVDAGIVHDLFLSFVVITYLLLMVLADSFLHVKFVLPCLRTQAHRHVNQLELHARRIDEAKARMARNIMVIGKHLAEARTLFDSPQPAPWHACA